MGDLTTAAGDVRFGLWYDLRNPAQWRRPFERFYAEVLDQITWAETQGIGSVWLTEHHFCDDGYTPSPLVVAGAIAARTTDLRISTNLITAAVHDPVRLAEDAATLGILSDGRFDLGIAVGYRDLEFEAFGRDIRHRPSLLEETVEIVRRALSGRSIAFEGKRFSYPDLTVHPRPARTPQVLIGGMTPPAIDRAARLGDGFLSTQNAHHEMYLEGLDRAGRPRSEGAIYAGQWAIVAEDPEAEWARIGQHALYQLNEYIGWGAFGPPDETPLFPDAQSIVDAGAFQLWDVDTAIRELSDLLLGQPLIRDVHFWAQLPGESVESGSARIETLTSKVLPAVRERLAAARTPAA